MIAEDCSYRIGDREFAEACVQLGELHPAAQRILIEHPYMRFEDQEVEADYRTRYLEAIKGFVEARRSYKSDDELGADWKQSREYCDGRGPVLYAVGSDWEHNGRDDSDWYQVGYDPVTDTLTRCCIGSTRYPGGVVNLPSLPLGLQAKAKECLRRRWAEHLRSADTWSIENPSETTLVGQRVILKKAARNRIKKEETCRRCDGKGHWQNPKRPEDKRKCFGCEGTGKRWMPQKKGPMVEYPAGTEGVVTQRYVNRSQYGTWDYGSRVEILQDNGEPFKAPVTAVKLARSPAKQEDIDKVARRQADAWYAYPLFGTAMLSAFPGLL